MSRTCVYSCCSPFFSSLIRLLPPHTHCMEKKLKDCPCRQWPPLDWIAWPFISLSPAWPVSSHWHSSWWPCPGRTFFTWLPGHHFLVFSCHHGHFFCFHSWYPCFLPTWESWKALGLVPWTSILSIYAVLQGEFIPFQFYEPSASDIYQVSYLHPFLLWTPNYHIQLPIQCPHLEIKKVYSKVSENSRPVFSK